MIYATAKWFVIGVRRVRFDGGMLLSNGSVMALSEVEKRLRVSQRLADCIGNPRRAYQIVHSVADMIGFRMEMIAAAYEDGTTASRLRTNPVFKTAQDVLSARRSLSGSQRCADWRTCMMRALLAMGRAIVDLYCASFQQVLKRTVLDIFDTFNAVNGGQQLRQFNAVHIEYDFQPIVVFDCSGRFVGAVLRPA